MDALISLTVSAISFDASDCKAAFEPLVICGVTRTFILDARTCQIHVIYQEEKQIHNSTTIFLTPLPASPPICLSLSPCGCFLAVITVTSVHAVDLSKLEATLHSKQEKIISKLVTVINTNSDVTAVVSRIVRVRWHPHISGMLTILTDDGRLSFCRCFSGCSFKVEQCLVVDVLKPRDQSELSSNYDKENAFGINGKATISLDLSAAMGATCRDFDFGSPLFSTKSKLSGEAILRTPVYVICENGDILLVSASPSSVTVPLVRIVRILPASEECYTYDFDTIVCLNPSAFSDVPDVICFSNRTGRIFHAICLHVPPAALQSIFPPHQGRSVPILHIMDSVDLDFRSLEKSFDCGTKNVDVANANSYSKLVLQPTSCYQQEDSHQLTYSYLCIHSFGIHIVHLPWVEKHVTLSSSLGARSPKDLGDILDADLCSVEYLLMTRGLQGNDAESEGSSRTIIGILPKLEYKDSVVDRPVSVSIRVVFSSKPEVVTVPLPENLNSAFSHPQWPAEMTPRSSGSDGLGSHDHASFVANSTKSTDFQESDFVKKCRATLSEAASSSHLPIMSAAIDDGTVCSESGFLRSFLRATESLRTSQQLARLVEMTAAVGGSHADHVEATLAAQSEEALLLSGRREALQARATALTQRHARILERQENLNHRLSDLARRLYSIEKGLTDAELDMSHTVQIIRDRLKSGLLGWLEGIRLRYDHLVKCHREHQLHQYHHHPAAVDSSSSSNNLQQQSPMTPLSKVSPTILSPAQIQSLAEILKKEGSEIDSLIRTVETLNLSLNS